MAPRRDDITIVPEGPDGPADGRVSYDRDFYSWALEQARLIRDGRLDAIDRENVAEEIESLGREQFNKLGALFACFSSMMLKWDFRPERRSRSWALSIETQRVEVEDVLGDNPGLKPRVPEAIARAYRKARLEAARETDMAPDRLPSHCPYGPDEITTRPFEIVATPSR